MSIEPKKMTQRALNALETRNKLFTTALTLFEEYGYNVVTVDDIARRAGYSKGTFYANFPSKDSVLLEQFRRIDEHYIDVFESVDENLSGSERIMLLFESTFDFCANVVGVAPLRIVYASQIASPDAGRILNNRDRAVYKIMRENVDLAKSQGDLPSDFETEQMVEDMLRISRGLIYDWCMYGNEFDLQEEGKRIFSHILRLLKLDAAQKA